MPNHGFRAIEVAIICLYAGAVIFMIARHWQNIVRLATGQEKKFYLFGKKSKKANKDKPSVEEQK